MVNNPAVKKKKNDVAIVDSSHISITAMTRVPEITEPKENDQNIVHLTTNNLESFFGMYLYLMSLTPYFINNYL